MKKNILTTLLILISIMISCLEKIDYDQPNIDIKSLERNYMKWWTYHNNNISLSSNFKAFDNSLNLISKEDFLKKLISGNFIPLKLISKDSIAYYKLFKLSQLANKSIKGTIIQVSSIAYKHFKMEGKIFPNFNFTDLKGIKYNNKNTKGKILVLKCWFINCKPCIAEFPKLNNLVEQNKYNKDIIFISLAFDSEENLKKFLLTKPFEYNVVPNQKEFMENILNVNTYPTHFIIDKNGKIKKVVNTVDELIIGLENEKGLTKKIEKIPPPPPPSSRKNK